MYIDLHGFTQLLCNYANILNSDLVIFFFTFKFTCTQSRSLQPCDVHFPAVIKRENGGGVGALLQIPNAFVKVLVYHGALWSLHWLTIPLLWL